MQKDDASESYNDDAFDEEYIDDDKSSKNDKKDTSKPNILNANSIVSK